jgi:hypothetical protein
MAALAFLLLFVIRLATVGPPGIGPEQGLRPLAQQASDAFSLSRKNYASEAKLGGSVSAPFPRPGAETQKYEKIGSLSQLSEQFDADRQKVVAAIASANAQVQLERATGLKGVRVLQLGIGVPPASFDAFVETVRGIGRNTAIEVVKNDKTNEYLQLRARRATLEKARTALEELKASGGSTDERVKVQNRLTEIESQIQDLGVSLGEFDSQNELCTVKLTLQEWSRPAPWSLSKRLLRAFELALTDYFYLGIGFLGLALAAWIGVVAVRQGRRLLRG